MEIILNKLQKQIEEGAPSDVFISAGESQMKALDEKGLIDKDSLSTLLKNQLVLISNTDTVKNMDDLSKVNHIAMGEPSSVPAGKYADESLTKLNLKESLKQKLFYGKDVKEVLSWVVLREAAAVIKDSKNIKAAKELFKKYGYEPY